jgi:sigma-B regulation protein RsbU (phosphoserine phosphatase)
VTRESDVVLEESAEELFEEAPCGYLTTDLAGGILRANRTLETMTGLSREQLRGRRFPDLLAPGGRIYYETHLLPLLHLQGRVGEIAVEVLRADGSRLPALVNAVLRRDAEDRPGAIRITVFDATDRRRYEEELRRGRDREHRIAQRLQESLLEGARLDDPRLPTGVEYVPSAPELQVGGDWYDVFGLDADRIALVVGDVVGRGLEAAATMGQLRSAIRALASTGMGPGAVLGALDAFAARHEVGRTATVAYVEVDVARGSLVMASAGHMPPALAAPGAPPRYLEGGRSAPLDAAIEPVPRPEQETALPDGALLVLYTDGLVERRGRPLSEALDELLERVGDHAAAAPQDAAAGIATAMLAAGPRTDDVCVLAARRPGPS